MTGAIQLATIRERATAAGISSGALAALLAGKIADIGLLGLAQIGVTALAALAAVHSVNIPALRGSVLAADTGPSRRPAGRHMLPSSWASCSLVETDA